MEEQKTADYTDEEVAKLKEEMDNIPEEVITKTKEEMSKCNCENCTCK